MIIATDIFFILSYSALGFVLGLLMGIAMGYCIASRNEREDGE